MQAHLRSHVALPPLPLLLFLHSLPPKHHFLQLVRQWVVFIGTCTGMCTAFPFPLFGSVGIRCVLHVHLFQFFNFLPLISYYIGSATGPVSPSPPQPHSTSAPTPPDKQQQGDSHCSEHFGTTLMVYIMTPADISTQVH